MWISDHFFGPYMPTRQHYYHIEACHRVAIFDWLIRWAEKVEHNYDDLYSGYPFSNHRDAEPAAITIRNARKTLLDLMAETEARLVISVLDYEIAKFANSLASWRGVQERKVWDMTGFMLLTDLSSYEP